LRVDRVVKTVRYLTVNDFYFDFSRISLSPGMFVIIADAEFCLSFSLAIALVEEKSHRRIVVAPKNGDPSRKIIVLCTVALNPKSKLTLERGNNPTKRNTRAC